MQKGDLEKSKIRQVAYGLLLPCLGKRLLTFDLRHQRKHNISTIGTIKFGALVRRLPSPQHRSTHPLELIICGKVVSSSCFT